MDQNPDGASPKEQTLFEEIRPYLRPDVRIQDIERESKTRRKRREVAQALRENGWYSKKDAQGYVRWYPHAAVPKDHRLRGNSTRFGKGGAAGGEIDQQWVKTERESDEPDPPRIPDNFAVKRVSTLVDSQGQVRAQWTIADKPPIGDSTEKVLRAWAEDLIAAGEMRGLCPLIPQPRRVEHELLAAYCIGDSHFGQFSWAEETGNNFDVKIAEKLTFGAVDRLASVAPPAETGLLIQIGDMFHADNSTNQTPASGHALDVDTRYQKVMLIGVKAMVRCVQRMLERHKHVVVWNMPGNHDPHSSYALAMCMAAYFEKEPRVTVDLSPGLFKYIRHGKVLIGAHHGHKVKAEKMPLLMAVDRAEDWGQTSHRYVYMGHIHHDTVKEVQGVRIESLRTLAGKDAWHAGMGYRAGRDMRLIVHHKLHGEIERHTCGISMLETDCA